METHDLDPRIQKICDGIKTLRKEAGYSAYENFAFENDLSRISYGRMERGANITLVSLLRILDIHKITLSDFMLKFGL